ncbi:MAG: transcriptional repressor LexA [Hyphomonadaceae bacterium]|nr:transcriptional repressor LexA [Clostridia bacterium]
MQRKDPEKKQKILDYIEKQFIEKGYPPSVREICAAVGINSTSTVHAYLESLKKDGLLSKDDAKTRTLRVIHSGQENFSTPQRELVHIPILGTVTAGQPILAVENIEDTFPLPVELAGNHELFMLKISGESMIEVGIYDGDLVIVKKQNVANNGDIVIALIEDEATCKTFYKEKGHFRLQPENTALAPIIVNEVSILGKVVGLFRMF